MPSDLSAMVRIMAHPDVDGIQVDWSKRPICVGIHRLGKWCWLYGATATYALAQAERVTRGLPALTVAGEDE